MHSRRILSWCSALLVAGFALPALAAPKPFTDSPTSPYYDAIEYGHAQGIFSGFDDGSFHPYEVIQRAEFAKIVASAVATAAEQKHCLKKRPELPFTDVEKTAWYAPAVCIGKERGFLGGYPDKTFRAGEPVNYAEATKIIAVAFKLQTDPKDGKYGGKPVWFRPYSLALARMKALPPTVQTYHHPMTRGEMAEIIYRLKTSKTSQPTVDTFIASVQQEDGFAFAYPANVFAKAMDKASVPFGDYSDVPGRSLLHSIPIEDCGESKDVNQCTPLTTDISIGFFVIPRALATLESEAEDWMTETLYSVAGRDGFTFTLGAEGSNTDYIFIPLTNDTTLMITRDYLDDTHALEYEREKGFIPLRQQQGLFEQVLSTLQFSSSLTQQTRTETSFTLFFYGKGDLLTMRFDYPHTVVRTIPATQYPLDTSLKALFAGPTPEEAEKGAGMLNELKKIGAFYEGVSVANGTATVRFSAEALPFLSGTSKRAVMLQEPIIYTLLQFDSVEDVTIEAGDETVH